MNDAQIKTLKKIKNHLRRENILTVTKWKQFFNKRKKNPIFMGGFLVTSVITVAGLAMVMMLFDLGFLGFLGSLLGMALGVCFTAYTLDDFAMNEPDRSSHQYRNYLRQVKTFIEANPEHADIFKNFYPLVSTTPIQNSWYENLSKLLASYESQHSSYQCAPKNSTEEKFGGRFLEDEEDFFTNTFNPNPNDQILIETKENVLVEATEEKLKF